MADVACCTTFPFREDVFDLGRFELESGVVLPETKLLFRTWGSLNRAADNAVVVFHSLTGDADITSWWKGLFGKNKSIDPTRHFVICANLIGSCYGSTGPTSINPETGQPWQASFPDVTVRDNVLAQQQLVRWLGVRRVDMVIGGSLGGMLALQWAAEDSSVRRVVAVATSAAHSAWCIAWSEAQRQAIFADPEWNGGYYAPDRPPAAGLAAARMMAMLSYRNPESFEERFGRAAASEPAHQRDRAHVAGSDRATANTAVPHPPSRQSFSVQGYLHHQGSKLVKRFDANSYVCLTRMANAHDLGLVAPASAQSGKGKKTPRIEQPVLLVGIPSDILFPMAEIRALAELLPAADVATLESVHGHDGFLIDADRLDAIIQRWSEGARPKRPSPLHASLTCIST